MMQGKGEASCCNVRKGEPYYDGEKGMLAVGMCTISVFTV